MDQFYGLLGSESNLMHQFNELSFQWQWNVPRILRLTDVHPNSKAH